MSTDAALAQLPSEAAEAVRAELAPGEQVVYAGVPRSDFDSGQLACALRGPLLLWPGLAASLFAWVIGAALLVTGARGVLQGTIDVFMATVLIVGLGGLLVHARHARRKAASSAWVVTDRRALGITTWPERSVTSIAPDDIEEVYCWIVSPNCGNVRFKSGIRSTAANALMYVPEPRACEAAMRALVPAHQNGDTPPMSFDEDEWTVITKDSNGNVLKDGDSVVVIKDLDVKGAKTTIKRGTTYKGIRTTSSAEEIEVREGKQVWVLKTCFVKKG